MTSKAILELFIQGAPHLIMMFFELTVVFVVIFYYKKIRGLVETMHTYNNSVEKRHEMMQETVNEYKELTKWWIGTGEKSKVDNT